MISRVHKMEDLGFTDRVAQSYSQELGRPFSKTHFFNLWESLLTSGTGAMWKHDTEGDLTGIIAGILYPDMFDGELVATEVVWYVSPVARSSRAAYDLWQELEMWAKSSNAARIYSGAAVGNPKLGQMFLKRGMKEMETYYTKDIA